MPDILLVVYFIKHIEWLFFTAYSYHTNFSAKSYQVESFLTSLLDCTFRCCHLKGNSKQNSKKVSMESSFYQQVLLSDMVINYSLLLLHKQFPDPPGLEATELGIWKQFSKQNGTFFRVLHDVNHRLVVARVAECADKKVYSYNSLSSGYTSKNAVKQICQINFFSR